MKEKQKLHLEVSKLELLKPKELFSEEEFYEAVLIKSVISCNRIVLVSLPFVRCKGQAQLLFCNK